VALSVEGPGNKDYEERQGDSPLVCARVRVRWRGLAYSSVCFINLSVYVRRALAGARRERKPIVRARASQPNLSSDGDGGGSSRSRVVKVDLAISKAERVRKVSKLSAPALSLFE
jgi:hypothetical protein